jgi:hypothetical protein
LIDHDREVARQRRSRPRVEEALALTLHGADWNAVAALEDQSERAVALALSAGRGDRGEPRQDDRGAGG